MNATSSARTAHIQTVDKMLIERMDDLRNLAEHLAEGIIVVDQSGLVLYANRAAEHLFAAQPLAPAGTRLEDLLPPGAVGQINPPGEPGYGEQLTRNALTLNTGGGKDQQVEIFTSTALAQAGTAWMRILLIKPLTEPDGSNQDLLQSEARYLGLVQGQNDLIFRFQPSGVLTFVNDAFCRFWQRSRESLLGTNAMVFVPREDRAAVRAQFSSLTSACPAVTYEMKVQRSTGQTAWLERTDRAIFNAQGKVVEYQSVCADISALRRFEADLKRQYALHNLLSETAFRFFNAEAQDLEKDIRRALNSLGEFCGADRCFLLLNFEQDAPSSAYEWISEHLHSPLSVLQQPLPGSGWLDVFSNSAEALFISPPDNIPAAARFLFTGAWQKFDLKGLLLVPLVAAGSCRGVLALTKESSEWAWSMSDSQLARLLGPIYTSLAVRLDAVQRSSHAQQQIERLESQTGLVDDRLRQLTEMSSMLQIANHLQEAYAIISQALLLLYPQFSGCLYLVEPGNHLLVQQCAWGSHTPPEKIVAADCWGLRLGRLYNTSQANLFCRHISPQDSPALTLCVPIKIHNKVSGILHLETHAGQSTASQADLTLAPLVGEQIGLALSNIMLREEQQRKSLRDRLSDF